jgi:tetratricopeptide (TPR) repeat protein
MVLRLHERDAELAVLDAALGDAVAGRGGTVVVQGPAGIGKTSLLDAARAAAPERGLAVAAARGSELETAYAWGVARQLLEPRLRGMAGAALERALDGAAALAAPVLLPERADGAAPADPAFGALHGLYWLVANLAAERPQLLVVDDLHWADEASARFLAFLANRIDALPVLLLAAQRPGGAAAPAPSALLEPRPLTLAGTAALIAERDGAGPDGLAAACHAATGGNPLLVRRLAEGLGDGDGADPAELVARVGPDALAVAVGDAIARLGEGPRDLAAAVAVLDTAPLVAAARLAGQEPAVAAAHAERLAGAGILRDARPLEFAHALVRDAVLNALSAGERTRLHGEAARLLRVGGAAPEEVAVHLLRTEPGGDPATAATLAEAGRRALASGATREAVALLERALAEPPSDGDRAALLLELARAQHGAGGAALEQVFEAYEVAGSPATRAEAVLCLQWAGGPGQLSPARAMEMLETTLAEVAGSDRELELRLESVRLTAAFMDAELMARLVGTAERFADLPGRTQGECELLLHAALHRFVGGRSAADVAELLERAVASPAVLMEAGPDSFHVPFVAGQLYKGDRLAQERRLVEWQLAESARRGSAPGFVLGSVDRAWMALREGDAIAAEADARAAYELVTDVVWHRHFAAAALVDVLVDRGGLDEAHAVLDAVMPEGGAGPHVGGELLLSTRSHLRAASGDARGALADQLAARATYGPFTNPDPNFPGWLRLARMLHATGDAEEARRESDAALAYARVWDTPGYIGQALTVAGLLRGGDEGLELLREAVAELERSPARRELAVSLVELGAALRRRGERVAAREPLRRALDLADAGGLDAIAERAREELRVTGARVRRPALSGLDSLTPSERRIVDLAASGMSNPAIARRCS